MTLKDKKEETLLGLQLAITDVMKPENLNRWVSAREASITKLLVKNGVNMNYSSAFLEELGKLGYVERQGQGCGLMYMVKTTTIVDSEKLALNIWDNFQARYSKKKGTLDGYQDSKKSDLRPKVNRKRDISKGENGAPTYIPKEYAKLGDMGYIITDNQIVQVRLIGIHYAPDGKKVLYDVDMSFKNDLGEQRWTVVPDICCGRFFRTPEQAAEYLMKKIVTYVKRTQV